MLYMFFLILFLIILIILIIFVLLLKKEKSLFLPCGNTITQNTFQAKKIRKSGLLLSERKKIVKDDLKYCVKSMENGKKYHVDTHERILELLEDEGVTIIKKTPIKCPYKKYNIRKSVKNVQGVYYDAKKIRGYYRAIIMKNG